MIGGLAATFGVVAFACWMLAITLLVYLSLRIDALRRSGDLPAAAPEVFTSGFGLGGGGIFLNVIELYSRRYREIDDHTRRLVPLIRVLMPLALALVLIAVAIHLWG